MGGGRRDHLDDGPFLARLPGKRRPRPLVRPFVGVDSPETTDPFWVTVLETMTPMKGKGEAIARFDVSKASVSVEMRGPPLRASPS